MIRLNRLAPLRMPNSANNPTIPVMVSRAQFRPDRTMNANSRYSTATTTSSARLTIRYSWIVLNAWLGVVPAGRGCCSRVLTSLFQVTADDTAMRNHSAALAISIQNETTTWVGGCADCWSASFGVVTWRTVERRRGTCPLTCGYGSTRGSPVGTSCSPRAVAHREDQAGRNTATAPNPTTASGPGNDHASKRG